MRKYLCLIAVVTTFLEGSPASEKVSRFHAFSNESSSDGEHSRGHTVWLWKHGKTFVGTIHEAEGAIGDGPKSFLDRIVFNENTKKIEFEATQTHTCSPSLETRKLSFQGSLVNGKLVGKFSYSPANDGGSPSKMTLNECCKDAESFANFPDLKSWKEKWNAFHLRRHALPNDLFRTIPIRI